MAEAVTSGGFHADDPAPLLQLTDVSRVYGEQVQVYALREVSLQINAGDLLAIIGPSGSGKSTMLGLLGVLDRPTEGTVEVAGHDTGTLDDAARSRLRGDTIGFVFQQFHLIPHLSAFGNVATALLYRGLTRRERRDRAHARAGAGRTRPRAPITGRCRCRVVSSSGSRSPGRSSPSRIMVLADEPTGALDSQNAANVMEIFAGLESARPCGRARDPRPRRRRHREPGRVACATVGSSAT